MRLKNANSDNISHFPELWLTSVWIQVSTEMRDTQEHACVSNSLNILDVFETVMSNTGK